MTKEALSNIKWKQRFIRISSDSINIVQNLRMNDPILYLSMILGFGGIYVLISSFHDDDDDSDGDGEKYLYNFEYEKAAR